jgi:hypothetical protein
VTDFCWFTSFIGYPNFFNKEGRGHDLATFFLHVADAADKGMAYDDAKRSFARLSIHQVETKKAAFQEAGLLYVVPRSNVITLTPVGRQIYDIVNNTDVTTRRRDILLILCRALARYQFSNPFPIGGNRYRERARSTDVLPYLAAYHLMASLEAYITDRELTGCVFSLQRMQDIHALENEIRDRRRRGVPFEALPSLPSNKETAENLRIYFVARLGLDSEILTAQEQSPAYGAQDRAFELTRLGVDVVKAVLDVEWPEWRRNGAPPVARTYSSIDEYFSQGVGHLCPEHVLAKDHSREARDLQRLAADILDPMDIESLRELPTREFEEGRKKLLSHTRLEKVRNSALVRAAKRLFKAKHGHLYCEVCAFDFDKAYGARGKNFIEAHHNIPVSEITRSTKVTVDNLTMLCSNCHRMIHRRPWLTVDGLKAEMAR